MNIGRSTPSREIARRMERRLQRPLTRHRNHMGETHFTTRSKALATSRLKGTPHKGKTHNYTLALAPASGAQA